MSSDIRAVLAAHVSQPPEDLVALYSRRTLPADPELRIRVLPLPEAIKYTQAIRVRAVLGTAMGLFALDDANDSNSYCYITSGPARGCILHLCHDGESAVEYGSLAAFLGAIDAAVEKRLHIDDLPGKDYCPGLDQQLLCDHISRLIAEDTEVAEVELTVLVPLVDTDRLDVVRSLARHPSFFVREAVTLLIASHPRPKLLDCAGLLEKDPHPQVARPGKVALSAVQRVPRGS